MRSSFSIGYLPVGYTSDVFINRKYCKYSKHTLADIHRHNKKLPEAYKSGNSEVWCSQCTEEVDVFLFEYATCWREIIDLGGTCGAEERCKGM